MRRIWMLSGVLCGVLLISPHARAKRRTPTEDGYQVATVVSVKKHVSASGYVGENPSDAPLQARTYAYDIALRLNCSVYVGRYESTLRYLPSVFTPDHEIDVRLRKHVLFVGLPFSDEEVMMGIVSRRRLKDEVYTATSSKVAAQISNHSLTQSKFKGGLV